MLDSVPRPTGSDQSVVYGIVTLRIPMELVAELKALAEKKERSINYIGARVIRAGLDGLDRTGWSESTDA